MIEPKNNDEKSTSFKGQLNSDYVYLSFTAQLITLCEPPSWLCKKLTHYDKFGVKQHELNIGVAKGWGNPNQLEHFWHSTSESQYYRSYNLCFQCFFA
jgi:hypothetical protein